MSNSSASALDLIVDFVNLAKGLNLSRADLSYGQPVLIDPTVRTLVHPTRRNTRVEVSFAGNLSHPRFEITAFYNRLYLPRLFLQVSKHVELADETSVHELLPKISAATQFNFLPEDVIDGEINPDGTFVLEAHPDSMGVFGEVEMTTAVDNTPPWISHNARIYLTARRIADFEDGVLLEQTTAEPIFAGRFDNNDNIFFEFSDLSDLTFEGGSVYAVPPADRAYTRLIDSYLNYPDATAYIGTVVGGMRFIGEIQEKEGSTDRLRVFGATTTDEPENVPYGLVQHLHWLRFSHPEFDEPINLLLQKGSLTMSNPLLDVLQTMLDSINEQKGLTLTKADVEVSELTLVNPSITVLTGPSRNSRLRLRTINNDQIDLTINYNRLSIPKLFDNRSTAFEDTGQTSITELLTAINTRTGANLVAQDVTAATIDPQTRLVSLTAAASSIAYFGTISLSLTGEVVEPEPEDDMVTDGFFVANMIGGYLTQDFATATTVDDGVLPLMKEDFNHFAMASGGYNNEILAVVETYDVDLGEEGTFLFTSHNGGDADWVKHANIEGWELAVDQATFFKGNAFFGFTRREMSSVYALFRMRSISNEGHEYAHDTVLELTDEFVSIVASRENIYVVTERGFHYSSDGVNWDYHAVPNCQIKAACSHNGILVAIARNYDGHTESLTFTIGEGTSVDRYPISFATHSQPGDEVEPGHIRMASNGDRVIMTGWLVVRNETNQTYNDYYGEFYTSENGYDGWQLRHDGTAQFDTVTPLLVDGDLIVAFGIFYLGDETPKTFMMKSVDGGLNWTVHDEDVTPVFGATYPLPNWGALRCYLLGEKPEDPTTPSYEELNLGSRPFSAGSTVELLVVNSDNSMVVAGAREYNSEMGEGESNSWQYYGGSRLTTLYPNGMVNPFRSSDLHQWVSGLVVRPDGKILVSGELDPSCGFYYENNRDNNPRPIVALLNSDLTPDWSFQAPDVVDFGGSWPNNPVKTSSVILMDDGTIYASGSFASAFGQTHYGIIRLAANGTYDTSFVSPIQSYGVGSLYRSPSGFIGVDAQSALTTVGDGRSFVMDSSGQVLSSMGDFGQSSTVTGIHDFGDGLIYLFGWFQMGEDEPVRSVRLFSDGSVDSSFVSFTDAIRPIKALSNGNLLVSREVGPSHYVLEEISSALDFIPYQGLRIAADDSFTATGLLSNNDLVVAGDFQHLYTKNYPLLDPVPRGHIGRLDSDTPLNFSNNTWFNEENIGLADDFKSGSLTFVQFNNPRNQYFMAAHRANRGVVARFAGRTGLSEGSDQPDCAVLPSVGGMYNGFDRWSLDIGLLHYSARATNLTVEVTLTVAQDTFVMDVVYEEGEAENSFRLISRSDSTLVSHGFWATSEDNDPSRRNESAVTFSVDGAQLINTLLPGHTFPMNMDGYVTLPISVSISVDGAERIVMGHTPPIGIEYPTWEPNSLVGSVHAPDGTTRLSQGEGNDEDGYFLLSRGAPISTSAGGQPMTALRAWDVSTGLIASTSVEMGEYDDELYSLVDRGVAAHRVDMIFGLNPFQGFEGNLLTDYDLLLSIWVDQQASIITYTGGFTDDIFFFTPDSNHTGWENFSPVSATWQSGDLSSLQLRYDLDQVYPLIPPQFWDGTGTVRLSVNLRMRNKITTEDDAESLILIDSTGGDSYPIIEHNVPAGDNFGGEGALAMWDAHGGSEMDTYFDKWTNAVVGDSSPVTAVRFYDQLNGPQPSSDIDGGLWTYALHAQDPALSVQHFADVLIGWQGGSAEFIGAHTVTVQFGFNSELGNSSTFQRYVLSSSEGLLSFVPSGDYGDVPSLPVTFGEAGSPALSHRFLLQDIYQMIPSEMWDGVSDFIIDITVGIYLNQTEELIGFGNVFATVAREANESYPINEYDVELGSIHAPGGSLQLHASAPTGDPSDDWFARSTGRPMLNPALGNPIAAARVYDTVTLASDTGLTGKYVAYNRGLAETEQLADVVVGHEPGANMLDVFDVFINFPVRNMIAGSGDELVIRLKAEIGTGGNEGEIMLASDPTYADIGSFPVNWTAPDFSSFQLRMSLDSVLSQVSSEIWDGTGEVIGFVTVIVYAKGTEDIVASMEVEWSSTDATNGDGGGGELQRGFFVSNPVMAARTMNFSQYSIVEDAAAPKVGPSDVVTHASGVEEQLVVFRNQGNRIQICISNNGGSNWNNYLAPIRFTGLSRWTKAAFFKGDYYIQLGEDLNPYNSPPATTAYGLFRLVNVGDEETPSYSFERVADIPISTWTGKNHTFSDGTYLYALGFHFVTTGVYNLVLFRTADLVTFEEFTLTDQSANLDAVSDVQRLSISDGKLYMVGTNKHPGASVGWGWNRMSYGVLDLNNIGSGISWRRDWPFTIPTLPAGWSWAAAIGDILATDQYLVAITGRNVLSGQHEGSLFVVSDEVGTIFVKPIGDMSAPWTIVNPDTGMENGRLALADERLLAFGKRSTDRTNNTTMTYSIDSGSGWTEWQIEEDAGNVFNQFSDASYAVTFDAGVLDEYEPLPEPPALETDLLPSVFGSSLQGLEAFATQMVEDSDGALYVFSTSAYLEGTPFYRIGKLLPYDGVSRDPARDTSYQARIANSANGSQQVTTLTSMAVDAEGRLYLGCTLPLWAWNGSGWSGGANVIRLLPNGLYDASYNLVALTHINSVLINRKNRAVVYNAGTNPVNNVTVGGSEPNNLIEIMEDGQVSTEFTSGLVRAAATLARITIVRAVWQMPNGNYILNVGANLTNGVNRLMIALSENGTALPATTMTYTGINVRSVFPYTTGGGVVRLVIQGYNLNASSGSMVALADLDLLNVSFIPANNTYFGTAAVRSNDRMWPLNKPNQILHYRDGSERDNTFRILDVSTLTEVGNLKISGVLAGAGIVGGSQKDILFTNARMVNQDMFPRKHPVWVPGYVAAIRIPSDDAE